MLASGCLFTLPEALLTGLLGGLAEESSVNYLKTLILAIPLPKRRY